MGDPFGAKGKGGRDRDFYFVRQLGEFLFSIHFFSIFFSILLFRDILSATVDLCLIEPSFWVTKRFSIASNWSAWGFYLVFFCVCVCVCAVVGQVLVDWNGG